MSTAGFLEELRRLKVHVRIEDGGVRVSAPRGTLSPELQAELVRRKPEILAYLQNGGATRDGRPPLRVVERTGDLPLSFAQRRVWFLEQLEPGGSAYTIAVRRPHTGPLDLPALRQALALLVQRHEALRTTFVRVQGQPVQRIGPPHPVDLRIIDVRREPLAERRTAADRALRIEAARPFDLERGPLFRPCLIRLAEEEHELLFATHHLVTDGWSVNLLARELAAAYDAFARGEEPALPDMPFQYVDYACWQRDRLSGDTLEEQTRFWRTALADAPSALDLPTDRPRGGVARGGGCDFRIPADVADRLRALARTEGATLFMTALSAFYVLLGRYSGQHDIVVGTPVANRTEPEVQNIVGFFANTLALRADLSDSPTFRELVGRVREFCLDAYAHQEMPFEKLVGELRPERVPGRNPLFQVSFVLQGEATGSDLEYVTAASPFEVSLYLRDRGAGDLGGTFEFRSDLFDHATMERMAKHFVNLVEAAVATPDRPISTLPLLDAEEARRILVDWNDTSTGYPRDRSIVSLFEDRVDASPASVAIRDEGTSVTYEELDRSANQLAHHLLAKGVRPGQIVALFCERSIDAVVATLAVLKAGAVYAPLELLSPPERIERLLEDMGSDLVLTDGSLITRLPRAARAIRLETALDAVADRPATRPGIDARATDPAYVMFTSGTSGRPKGVAVPHRGVVRLVCGTSWMHFAADEIMLQFATLSFDAATFEIWGALLNGGRLALAAPGSLSLEELESLIAREGVTCMVLTTAFFHQVAEHRPTMLRGVRQIMVGGDALSPVAARSVLDACPDLRLVNGYGPTENTTITSSYVVPPGVPADRSIPIGRPIANTRVYVLDPDGNPSPVGIPGELCAAGDGLAIEYVNRPDRTAESFVTRQLSGDLLERLYRTGDRARWLADGTLEFLGRLDAQVKVRGYRVEPGEVEAALLRMPGVQEAAVVVRETAGTERRLIAYVVAPDHTPSALRVALHAELPEYMIPSDILRLERLPLTTTGKLDRQALPDPEPAAAPPPAVPPRDDVERRLVRVWQEVLERDTVSIHDDFFELGGHSLLAVALFTRIETTFGVALPLATLFRTPTPEGLARLIRAGRRPEAANILVPIRATGYRTPLFALPGVGGNVLTFRDLARELPADRPFYGLQSRGLEGDAEPLTSIEAMASASIEVVREVQPQGPYLLIGACMGGVIAYEMAQQLRKAGEEVGLLALVETWPPDQTPANVPASRSRVSSLLLFLGHRLRRQLATLVRLRGRERIRFVAATFDRIAAALARRSLSDATFNDYRLRRVEQANLLAVRQYVPRPYEGDAVAILAADRPLDGAIDHRLAWHKLVRGTFEVHQAPGADSGLMMKGAQAQVLARRLLSCLPDA